MMTRSSVSKLNELILLVNKISWAWTQFGRIDVDAEKKTKKYICMSWYFKNVGKNTVYMKLWRSEYWVSISGKEGNRVFGCFLRIFLIR